LKKANAMVIDADGLWHLTRIKGFGEFLIPTVLTPHPGEMAMLVEAFLPEFSGENRFEQALELAERLNCYIVLKGKFTFVASPQYDSWIITSGNESLATAGSGDVLAGIIAAFLAEALTSAESVVDAINSAVFIHGKLGEIAPSSRALIADDLPSLLVDVLK
ncbi:MAG: ADP-dependent NAD(P)H-hydrate dehydratase, partial [Lentisphaeria bacterium]